MLLSETFFGLLLHEKLRGHPWFTYPEEKDDFKVPQRYTVGYKSQGVESTEVIKSCASLECPPRLDCVTDPYLVEWDGKDDPDKPQAWPLAKKMAFIAQLMLLTTSVYVGSSIITPGIPLIAAYFGVGRVPATLSLTFYVLAFGIGPMIGLCAASEVPAIGRCRPYIISLFLYVILQVPTALSDNLAGLLILRFLAGLFGSPSLATGGASVWDVFEPANAPYALGFWGLAASGGPVLGPLIGGFASRAYGLEGWRWTIWPLLMLSGFALVVLTFSMPETSSANILARRAQRLRKRTGNPHLRSRGELWSATMTGRKLALVIFVRPFVLGLTEPIALGINVHMALVYGVLYTWFEAFPLVFIEIYGFNPGETGLAFFGILFGAIVTYLGFCVWYKTSYLPVFYRQKGKSAPELWLTPGMVGALSLPISLFSFGWTSNADIHWIVPIICSSFFGIGIFGIYASGLNYLALCYPDYLASVFSANGFLRTVVGAAMPLVAKAMFQNLQKDGPRQFPVAWGCTLLGAISVVLMPVPFLLHRYGPKLRKMSKYAIDPQEIDLCSSSEPEDKNSTP